MQEESKKSFNDLDDLLGSAKPQPDETPPTSAPRSLVEHGSPQKPNEQRNQRNSGNLSDLLLGSSSQAPSTQSNFQSTYPRRQEPEMKNAVDDAGRIDQSQDKSVFMS